MGEATLGGIGAEVEAGTCVATGAGAGAGAGGGIVSGGAAISCESSPNRSSSIPIGESCCSGASVVPLAATAADGPAVGSAPHADVLDSAPQPEPATSAPQPEPDASAPHPPEPAADPHPEVDAVAESAGAGAAGGAAAVHPEPAGRPGFTGEAAAAAAFLPASGDIASASSFSLPFPTCVPGRIFLGLPRGRFSFLSGTNGKSGAASTILIRFPLCLSMFLGGRASGSGTGIIGTSGGCAVVVVWGVGTASMGVAGGVGSAGSGVGMGESEVGIKDIRFSPPGTFVIDTKPAGSAVDFDFADDEEMVDVGFFGEGLGMTILGFDFVGLVAVVVVDLEGPATGAEGGGGVGDERMILRFLFCCERRMSCWSGVSSPSSEVVTAEDTSGSPRFRFFYAPKQPSGPYRNSRRCDVPSQRSCPPNQKIHPRQHHRYSKHQSSTVQQAETRACLILTLTLTWPWRL